LARATTARIRSRASLMANDLGPSALSRVSSATSLRAWPIPLSKRTRPSESPRETSPILASRRPLTCRLLRWRRSQTRIAGQIAVSQPLAGDRAERLHEAPTVASWIAPLVVPEDLLVNVPMKVKRIYGDIGTTQTALQKAPKVSSPFV
jgi:hypothetical protein